MKMWVTKHALTRGIREIEGVISESGLYVSEKGDIWSSCKIGTDAFPSRAAAITRAHNMRRRKIENLLKQIEKLEKIEFGGDDDHES